MTLSMPALNNNWPSNKPAGPAPMMATWVRMWKPPDAHELSRFRVFVQKSSGRKSTRWVSSAYSSVTLANNYTVVWVSSAGPKMAAIEQQSEHETHLQDHPGRHRTGRQQPRGRASPDFIERLL